MTADELRRFALSLPETEERETWGEATFRVRDKIFAMLRGDGDTASIKATLSAQDILVRSDPETFAIAPYTGRFGWVAVHLATVDPDLMHRIVADAWRQTAPKRLVAAFDACR